MVEFAAIEDAPFASLIDICPYLSTDTAKVLPAVGMLNERVAEGMHPPAILAIVYEVPDKIEWFA